VKGQFLSPNKTRSKIIVWNFR